MNPPEQETITQIAVIVRDIEKARLLHQRLRHRQTGNPFDRPDRGIADPLPRRTRPRKARLHPLQQHCPGAHRTRGRAQRVAGVPRVTRRGRPPQ